jgi:hypothetical protein
MDSILQVDDLPAGQFEIMLYEIYLTDKKNKYVITARELDGSVYMFYANTLLEDFIKNMPDKKSFVFYNDRLLKAQIKIVSDKIIL